MKEIIINKDNLTECDIQEKRTFHRFIFLNENFEILVNNKKGIYSLPPDIANKQDIFTAIVNEVNRQNTDELQNIKISHFEKNHLKRNGKTTNRLVITHYFITDFPRNINYNKDLCKYEIIPIDNLNSENANIELLEISKYIKNFNIQKTKEK